MWTIYRQVADHSEEILFASRSARKSKISIFTKSSPPYYSPYFRVALSAGFEEAKTVVMTLPKTDATVFEIFYGWLYRQKLWNKYAKEENWSDTEDLVKLYVFVDMTRIPSLQKPGIESNPQDIRYQHQLPRLHDGLCLRKHSLNKPSPPLLPCPNFLGICT
jgi:hypothetical protein